MQIAQKIYGNIALQRTHKKRLALIRKKRVVKKQRSAAWSIQGALIRNKINAIEIILIQKQFYYSQ